ncbi:hypothetical protein TCAL_10924 [Tigriopus californicus]|uniref:AB hydrolase-1 domain-containing protein n=2 Tax=Tigriopus californicus TaxID=6832 RepID=A0A553N709_TIGCA|nr:valacyclovir hydrolase-like isoform X1 [Tigriopus californicus]XP_059088565.1 valacyclovir hydrolase-like isoform X1 [Tigriopus californicus]XP_059088566.1 valacyclovir hydrolase-like isoform X1 [Tigriopus californicus]TRY61217.1 hypothetical protein TCAL_10924 [Tigriopus californicus]
MFMAGIVSFGRMGLRTGWPAIPQRSMSSPSGLIEGPNTLTLSQGQKIHYEARGQGSKAALLMPGALGTASSDFAPQLQHFSGHPQLRVIAWDPPGYGASRPPARTWPLDFFDRDAKLAIDLMDQLGFDQFSVLGWSDGGITGMVMAAEYTEQIEKLVVWGANAFISAQDVQHITNVSDVSQWSERMRRPMEETYGVDYFPIIWKEWCQAYRAVFEKNQGEICRQRLAQIQCPTLIVHGDKDAMLDTIHPDILQREIPNARLERFPDGKHNLHFKYQKEFNQMTEEFLSAN